LPQQRDDFGTTVDIDTSTVGKTTNNSPNNIVGPYTSIPNC
jgi:hypothetical protein